MLQMFKSVNVDTEFINTKKEWEDLPISYNIETQITLYGSICIAKIAQLTKFRAKIFKCYIIIMLTSIKNILFLATTNSKYRLD